MTADASELGSGSDDADDSGRTDERPRAGGDSEGEDDADGPVSAVLVERVVVAASVVLIVTMLGYVLWQAAVTPAVVDPHASVDAVEPMADSDRERVSVVLANDGNVGLASVTVVVDCGDRQHTLEFSHVPGNGEREGTVVCPAGSRPRAFVDTWIEA
jgi:hypothetical protein